AVRRHRAQRRDRAELPARPAIEVLAAGRGDHRARPEQPFEMRERPGPHAVERGLVERDERELEASEIPLRQLVLEYVVLRLEGLPDRARMDGRPVRPHEDVFDAAFELGEDLERAAART